MILVHPKMRDRTVDPLVIDDPRAEREDAPGEARLGCHGVDDLRDERRPVVRVARRGGRAAGYRRRPEWNLSTESTTKGGAVEMGRAFSSLKYENGNRENAST